MYVSVSVNKIVGIAAVKVQRITGIASCDLNTILSSSSQHNQLELNGFIEILFWPKMQMLLEYNKRLGSKEQLWNIFNLVRIIQL